jgi:hypothetical protein
VIEKTGTKPKLQACGLEHGTWDLIGLKSCFRPLGYIEPINAPKFGRWSLVRLEIVDRKVTEDKACSARSFHRSKATPNERKERGEKSEESKNERTKTTGRRSRKNKFEICGDEELRISPWWLEDMLSISPGQLDFGA